MVDGPQPTRRPRTRFRKAQRHTWTLILALLSLGLCLIVTAHTGWAQPPRKPLAAQSGGQTVPFQTQKAFKILCLGDSLTDGYGVARDAAWPALLADHLKRSHSTPVQVVNAGLSGSTSASGLSRLKWQLKSPQKPDLLILALGANDGLRGIDVKSTRNNLDGVIKLAQENKIQIVLAGMQMPTNYGPAYTEEFSRIFKDLAQTHKIPLIPFLLEGVATIKDLNQSDGIHPNEAGYKRVVQNVIPVIIPLIPTQIPGP